MSPQGPQRLGAEGFSGANISGSEIFSSILFSRYVFIFITTSSSRFIDVYSYQLHHSSLVFNKNVSNLQDYQIMCLSVFNCSYFKCCRSQAAARYTPLTQAIRCQKWSSQSNQLNWIRHSLVEFCQVIKGIPWLNLITFLLSLCWVVGTLACEDIQGTFPPLQQALDGLLCTPMVSVEKKTNK